MIKKIIIVGLVILFLIVGVFVYYGFFSVSKAKSILRDEVLAEKSKCKNGLEYSEEKCLAIIDCVADKVEDHYSEQRGLPSFARKVKSGKTDFLELGIVKSFSVSCGLEVTLEREFFER